MPPELTRASVHLQRHRLAMAIGVGVLLAVLFATVFRLTPATRLEAIAYDLRLILTLPERHDDRVVIVDIDDASLAQEGRWPWPRAKLGRLVERLFGLGAAVVGLDVVFAEADESDALRQLEGLIAEHFPDSPDLRGVLDRLRPRLDQDVALAASLRDKPVVLAYFFNDKAESQASSGASPRPLRIANDLSGRRLVVPRAYAYGGNIPSLAQAAKSAGFFNVDLDADGVLRRAPMLFEFDGEYYGSLALETARLFLGADTVSVQVGRLRRGTYAVERLVVAGHVLPTDEAGRVLVPFIGPWKSFPYIPAGDVLAGRVGPEPLRGRIVLVGATATAMADLYATPAQSPYPGIEVHASILSGLLDQAPGGVSGETRPFRHQPSWGPGAEVTLLVILGVLLVLLLPGSGFPRMLAVTAGAAAAVVGLNALLWWQGVVLGLAMPLVLIVTQFVAQVSYGFFHESRRHRHLQTAFGQYVPPELVSEMSRRDEGPEGQDRFGMEGESRDMSVLFADIRGFSGIAEGLTPTELRRLLNRFFSAMTRIIHAHRGTIDKYVGDMAMAFWGAPLHDPNHARHAVEAAMAMRDAEARLAEEYRREGLPPVSVGIGINSGAMNVGNMGSEFRVAYTVIGDAVNLASRLQSLTRAYGAGIIVSHETRRRHEGILFRELDRVRVRGRQSPEAIYEPLVYRKEASDALLHQIELHHDALRIYREGDWDLAELRFLDLDRRFPGQPLCALYLRRVRELRQRPPARDWQGVYELEAR